MTINYIVKHTILYILIYIKYLYIVQLINNFAVPQAVSTAKTIVENEISKTPPPEKKENKRKGYPEKKEKMF